jgi:hypothetical protein
MVEQPASEAVLGSDAEPVSSRQRLVDSKLPNLEAFPRMPSGKIVSPDPRRNLKAGGNLGRGEPLPDHLGMPEGAKRYRGLR